MDKYDRKEQLKELHHCRKAATREKAESAIMRLVRSGRAVNFNSVSAESGLSKATLYNNSDLRENIEKLRFQQSQVPSPAAIKHEMSDKNKDALIDSLKRKVEKLTEENRDLQERLKIHYADFYENI